MLYCFVHSCFNNYRKCFFITLFINPFADVQKKIPLPSWKKKTFSPDEEIFVTNFFLAVYLALLQILYFFAYCSVVDIVLSIILYCCTSSIFAYFVLLYNMNCSSSCIDKDTLCLRLKFIIFPNGIAYDFAPGYVTFQLDYGALLSIEYCFCHLVCSCILSTSKSRYKGIKCHR